MHIQCSLFIYPCKEYVYCSKLHKVLKYKNIKVCLSAVFLVLKHKQVNIVDQLTESKANIHTLYIFKF